VHGGAAHAHWYDFVAADYVADFHVRSIDLRGHGDSDWKTPPSYLYRDYAADLDAAVRAMGWRDYVLMGHSMGGMVALLHAALFPGRVSRLVIVDTLFDLPPERVARLRGVGEKPGTTYASRDELAARYRLRPGGSIAPPEVVRHIAVHSGRPQEDGGWRLKFDRAVYATREAHDGVPYWSEVRVPALLVRGGESERISEAMFGQVKARCRHAELATIEGAHHHVMLDCPAAFNAAVKDFLRRTA
jgi:pimeloyl-ACP methyl ester carboxylesterase